MKLLNNQNIPVQRIHNIVEYEDGNMQIFIMTGDGKVFAKTDQFPAHELQDQMSIFLGTPMEQREIDDTNPLYVIDGGIE